MSSQFHNRLVGTVVLVALGVIFLPDILDGKKERQEEQFSEIPLRPALVAQQQAADDMFEELSSQTDEGGNWTQVDSSDTPANGDESAPPELKPAKVEVAKVEKSAVEQPKIDTKPEVKSTPKAEVKSVTKQVANVESKPAPAKPVVKTEPKTVTAKTSNKPGLTLQLGAFSNAANVKALVAQLRKGGFRAYTIPENPKDGVLTKVFVGPDVSEAKLKKMQADIESLTKLKGRIVPFNPLES